MKATPIPFTMLPPPPPPVKAKRPLRVLVDTFPPAPPPLVRPNNRLAELAQALQHLCGIADPEWEQRRNPYTVSCRRGIAVMLRRAKFDGMTTPSSYPEIAAAMGKANHSSVLQLCADHFNDKEAVKATNWMAVYLEKKGIRMWPMSVVYGVMRATSENNDSATHVWSVAAGKERGVGQGAVRRRGRGDGDGLVRRTG